MSVDKTVLITGITGQDGSYLSDLLVSKGYKVIGLVRRTVASNDEKYRNISHLLNNKNFILESGDITDSSSIWRLIDKYRPSEVYNLAAQSHVGESYHSPISTAEIDAIGPLHILEAIRNIDKSIRFYQASTSEMFGDLPGPQGAQGASAATAITNNTDNFIVTATGNGPTPFNGETNLRFNGSYLSVSGSGSTIFSVDGSVGRLFTVLSTWRLCAY